MKAAYIEACGDPAAIRFGDQPKPCPASDDVLVEIVAASVNAADWKTRQGLSPVQLKFPHVLGRDFSGSVVWAGPKTGFESGDEVYAVCPGASDGAYAERIAIGANLVAKKPINLSHVESAACALAGLTALISLADTLAIQPGERLLIQGAAGGVGTVALQIAKAFGAHVVASARTANLDYVSGWGADEVLDYADHNAWARLTPCDAAFDAAGGDAISRTFAALKPGGRAAFVAVGREPPPSPRPDIVSLRPDVVRSRAALERLTTLIEKGAVRPPDIRTFPLAKAAEAHAIGEAGGGRGKLVLVP